MILNKKTLSRTIQKSESVGEKRVSQSGDRKHFFVGPKKVHPGRQRVSVLTA